MPRANTRASWACAHNIHRVRLTTIGRVPAVRFNEWNLFFIHDFTDAGSTCRPPSSPSISFASDSLSGRCDSSISYT
jgi:hypothetical protein